MGGHNWPICDTIRFTKNWVAESPLALRFAFFENPRSIEFPTLATRWFYPSFPPGNIIPVYIISKLTGHQPTPALVMSYNLLNHFLITLFLSLTVFLFLRSIRVQYTYSCLLSIIPIFVYLFMPGTLYYHQNVYFHEQAVILPFVLFIFLEVLLDVVKSKRAKATVKILQAFVMFFGILVDWLFLFITIAVYVKRAVTGEFGKKFWAFLKRSFFFLAPAMLALCLYLTQLAVLSGFGISLWRKILFRVGLSRDVSKYTKDFPKMIARHMSLLYGKISAVLLAITCFAVIAALVYLTVKLIRKKHVDGPLARTVALAGIIVVPCVVHPLVFRGHVVFHDYSVLKFAVVLSAVTFVLLPLMAILFLRSGHGEKASTLNRAYMNRKRMINVTVVIVLLLFAIGLSVSQLVDFRRMFPKAQDFNIEKFVGANTDYNDIVFSPYYQIPMEPAQQLSFSMKRVYLFSSIDDIMNKVREVKGDYVVNVLLLQSKAVNNQNELEKMETGYIKNNEEEIKSWMRMSKINTNPEIKYLIKISNAKVVENGRTLLKIQERDFLEKAQMPVK